MRSLLQAQLKDGQPLHGLAQQSLAFLGANFRIRVWNA